jgi:iron complex transport system permease protein
VKGREKYRLRFIILALSAVAIFLLSFFLGRYKVGFSAVIKILLDRLLRLISLDSWSMQQSWTAAEASVVASIRLPRIGCAALVGCALSVAGACYQGMFRNPMVSPDILGASTGSGFGAALSILLGFSYAATAVTSFASGLAAVLVAWLISRKSRMQTSVAMVLSGVMVGSLFQSGTSFIKLVADTESQLPAITYYLMGSLSSVKAIDFRLAVVPILIGFVPLFLLRWRINLLTVSEAEARSMGVETGRLRFIVIMCATLMTSASVSISGMIGWVGLVIPHFCRILFGNDYRRLIPSCALLGASFLMLVDDLARIVATSEIPLGILTSFVGAPVFILMILRGGSGHED